MPVNNVVYEIRTFIKSQTVGKQEFMSIVIEETSPKGKKNNEFPTEYRFLVNLADPTRPELGGMLAKILLPAKSLEQAYSLLETREQIESVIQQEVAKMRAAAQNRIWRPGDPGVPPPGSDVPPTTPPGQPGRGGTARKGNKRGKR